MKKFKFQQGGSISKLGYSKDSPYKNRDYIFIESDTITMANTEIDLYGIPVYKDGSYGKPVLMKAGRKEPYVFKDAVKVLEVPVRNLDMVKEKFKFKKGGKVGKIAVFAYSHLQNPDNIEKIIGRKPKLTEHHLDGFKKTEKNSETVIVPDNKSTVRGMKFYVTQAELNKINKEMSPYKAKQIGGDSTYSKLFTYYNNGGQMKKFRFTKKYQTGGTNKPKNTTVGFAVEENGKLQPVISITAGNVRMYKTVSNADLVPVEYKLDDRGTPIETIKSKWSNQGKLIPIKDQKQFMEFARKIQETVKSSQKKQYQTGGMTSNSDMVLLDHQGKPQMEMEGGELIFSRPITKKMVDLASKAVTEEDFYKLGKVAYDERMAQRKRDGE